jgi:hypothetical protein
MPELREVFEMTTKQMEPDVDAWRHQEVRQRRSARNKRIGAFAVAAVIAAAAVTVVIVTRAAQDTVMPAGDPVPVAPTAVEVATGFVEAYGRFDVDEAITYLADDADIAGLVGGLATLKDFRLDNAWSQASGYRQTLSSCEEVLSTASGTDVRCAFDWHVLRSDEIGLGPYNGSFDLTVRDGEVVRASVSLDTNEFSPQVWEPFAEWVATSYPKDAAVMYEDESYSNFRLTGKSIRLWEEHTREYVEHVTEGTA